MFQTFKLLAFMELLQLATLFVYTACTRKQFRACLGKVEILLLLATPVVGLFGHDKTIFYLYAAFIPLTAVGHPEKLAKRYVLMMVSFPMLIEQYVVGGQYIGRYSGPAFLSLGAVVALLSVGGRKNRTVFSLGVAVWAIYLASLLLDVKGIPMNGVLREVVPYVLGVAIPFYVTAQAIRSREAAGATLMMMVLGGLANAVVALFESLRHWPLYQSFYDHLHVSLEGLSATLAVRSGLLRAQGMVGNYETLGLLTGLALIVAVAIRTRFTRPGFWVVVGLLAGGCLVSQSRGAWFATVIGLAAYALYERRWAALAGLVAAVSALAVAVAILASAGGRVGQLVGRSGQGQQTAEYRSNLLSRGIAEVRAHPLTGQTRDQLEVSMNDLRQGQHIIDYVNTHLNVALIGGLPLLVVWIAAWLTPLCVAWRVRYRPASRAASAPVALPFALVAVCLVFVSFTSATDRILMVVTTIFGLMSAFVRLSSVPPGIDARPRRERQRLVAIGPA